MSSASIPVDLLSPGQVFAALGFLDAAYVLCGDAEGGFDWSGPDDVRFLIRTTDARNPFAVVLEFLAEAEVSELGPRGYAHGSGLKEVEAFPAPKPERMALPVWLERNGQRLTLTHWCDGSSRDTFKLYAGNRSAARIARAMLRGEDNKTKGLRDLRGTREKELLDDPFGVLTPIGGSFNFDPRAAWTRLDAGYSPNDHGHRVLASPAVEILAAIGLEYARPPRDRASDDVRYATWRGPLPPSLARAALGCAEVSVPTRTFRFTLARAGQNKVVAHGHEEIAPAG